MHGNKTNQIYWLIIYRLFRFTKRPIVRKYSYIWIITLLSAVWMTILFISKRFVLFESSIVPYIDKSDCAVSSATYLVDTINSEVSRCNHRSTRRGKGQRVIAISLYGPKENDLFQFNNTLHFLYELIDDARKVYPEWILRIYHDATIPPELVADIQCAYMNVDFCDMSSYNLIPAKTWRFFAAGDSFVDASKSLYSSYVNRNFIVRKCACHEKFHLS